MTPSVMVNTCIGTQISVIVIEDDTLVLEGLRLLLESFGYKVTATCTGEEALALLRDQGRPPDLILSDYNLQNGERGDQCINYLRLAFGLSIPGILLTGSTVPGPLKEIYRNGFCVLHKPITPEALLRAVKRALRRAERQ